MNRIPSPIHRLIGTTPVTYPEPPESLPSIGRLRFNGPQIVFGASWIANRTTAHAIFPFVSLAMPPPSPRHS